MSGKEDISAYAVHMDNPMSHNGHKISQKLANRNIERATDPPYSPDISPCDFWLCGVLKHNMKDREFRIQQTILSAVAKMWNDLIFADVQRVFQEWMDRLTWVIGNNGEYSPN
jgi:histone-lysine N-methyltransferase SETMAR